MEGLQAETRFVADWVLDRCRPAYGPGGGLVLLAPEGELHDSAAVLRDLPSTHPGLAPYKRLVAGVHRHAGDHGNLALLLAAGTVHRAHRAMDDGVPRAAILDGIQLAARQLRAWLPAHARPAEAAEALAGVDPADWRTEALAGLERLVADGRLELDQVDIHCEDGPVWQDGLRLELHGKGPGADAKILILDEGPRRRLAHDAVRTFTQDHEAAIERAWLDQIERLGATVVLVSKSLGDLRGRLASRMYVVDDVPKDVRRRIQVATGAEPVGRVEEATAAALGVADIEAAHPCIGGHVIHGPGPGATFSIGRRGEVLDGLWRDRAERFLRAAGLALADPRVLPGGGRWQRDANKALLRMVDLAPGKAGFGVRVVASALDDMVRTLLLNAGRDPLDGGVLDDVPDGAAGVEHAVAAALEVAVSLLRIDGRISKKESAGVDLRGGTAKAGSPKGMPGDIPPLM